MRQLEYAVGKCGPRAVDRLHGAADRIAILIPVVLGEAPTRLHRIRGDPVDHSLVADDMVGLGESTIDGAPVTDFVEERLVARVVIP